MERVKAHSYIFKDLVVTLLPRGGDCDATSGGCGGTCDAGSGGTVGSCTSECGGQVACGQSDEVLNPLTKVIDPQIMVDLRLMLRLAVAKSRSSEVPAIEAAMKPNTLSEVESLEKQLNGALADLAKDRKRLEKK
jgi:hypothetical protein